MTYKSIYEFDKEFVNSMEERVQNYQTKLLEKEKLENEKAEWDSMYDEVQDIVNILGEKYHDTNNLEDKEKFDSWLEEKKAYIDVIDEYTRDLDKINKELNVYSNEDYRREFKFLQDLTEFQQISERIKEIQNQSLKAITKQKKNLEKQFLTFVPSKDAVECKNAEGRKKLIIPELSDEYKKLVEKKILLSKNLKKAYDIIFNGYYESKEEPLIAELVDEELTEESNLEQLSEKENILKRIEELEKEKEELKAKQGRKDTVKCSGAYISRKFIGKYIMCCAEINKLKNKLRELNVEDENIDNNTFKNDNKKQSNGIQYSSSYPVTYLDYNTNKKDILPISMEDEGQLVDINKYHTPKDIVPSNNSNELAIISTKKPKRLKKLKNIIKAAAVVIGAAIVISSCNAVKNLFNKHKTNEPISKPSVSTINENNNDQKNIYEEVADEIKQDNQEDIKDNNVDTPSMSNYQMSDYSFDANFTVNNNSKIYENVNDATNEVNSKEMHFENNKLRETKGLSIKTNNSLVSFVEISEDLYEVTGLGNTLYLTKNEANQKIEYLLNNGGQITSVLSGQDNDYEGFFNVQDVNLVNGGMHR